MDKKRLNVYMTIRDGFSSIVVVLEGKEVLHEVSEIGKLRTNQVNNYLNLLNKGIRKATGLLNTKLINEGIELVNFVLSSRIVLGWVTQNAMRTSETDLFLDTVKAIDELPSACAFTYQKYSVANNYCFEKYLSHSDKLKTVDIGWFESLQEV